MSTMREFDPGRQASWLLRSKVSQPRLAARVIARNRLIDLIDAELNRRIVIGASAGYGKSTLLLQLSAHFGLRGEFVSWLNIDETDRNTDNFLAGLISSIEAAGLRLPSLTDAVKSGFLNIRPLAALDQVLLAIEEANKAITLILDDYNHVVGSAVDGFLDALLARQPNNLRLIVAGRGRPGFRLEHLQSAGHALLLEKDRLRFTATEIEDYLGGRASQAEARLLALRTEGWPVAIQLALVWLEWTARNDWSGCVVS